MGGAFGKGVCARPYSARASSSLQVRAAMVWARPLTRKSVAAPKPGTPDFSISTYVTAIDYVAICNSIASNLLVCG